MVKIKTESLRERSLFCFVELLDIVKQKRFNESEKENGRRTDLKFI